MVKKFLDLIQVKIGIFREPCYYYSCLIKMFDWDFKDTLRVYSILGHVFNETFWKLLIISWNFSQLTLYFYTCFILVRKFQTKPDETSSFGFLSMLFEFKF